MTTYTSQRPGARIGMMGLWANDVFFSKARSMARFGLFILARGSWNGTQIMTDTVYFRRMTTPSPPARPPACVYSMPWAAKCCASPRPGRKPRLWWPLWCRASTRRSGLMPPAAC